MNFAAKEIMSTKASSSEVDVLQIGQTQCNNITKERLNALNMKTISLCATISKNNLTLFRCKAAVTVSKDKKQTSALKKRVQPYSNLYIGCHSRQATAKYENL